jgi:hypothetical protein
MGSDPMLYNGSLFIPCGGGVEYLHLLFVEGNEKGSLESETVEYGAGKRQQQL